MGIFMHIYNTYIGRHRILEAFRVFLIIVFFTIVFVATANTSRMFEVSVAYWSSIRTPCELDYNMVSLGDMNRMEK